MKAKTGRIRTARPVATHKTRTIDGRAVLRGSQEAAADMLARHDYVRPRPAVIIPFRHRDGGDPLRKENLDRVVEHWEGYDCDVLVSDDGRTGDAPFNRSAAYNRATIRGFAGATTADMLIFAESDLIVSYAQIDRAIAMAATAPGMVVPFSWFMAIDEYDSRLVREHRADPEDCATRVVKGHRQSIGAVNVLSRQTLHLIVSWDELFEGAWYDDDAMKIAFDIAAGPTRFVEGSGYHLHHASGGRGKHLSEIDRAATAANRRRLQKYRQARTPEQIIELTQEAWS